MDAPKLKRRRFNWVISDIVRKGLQLYLEWSARQAKRWPLSRADHSKYNWRPLRTISLMTQLNLLRFSFGASIARHEPIGRAGFRFAPRSVIPASRVQC